MMSAMSCFFGDEGVGACALILEKYLQEEKVISVMPIPFCLYKCQSCMRAWSSPTYAI